MGFEDRIAAAFQVTTAAADAVRALVRAEVESMTAPWVAATTEIEALDGQAAAISAAVDEYKQKLSRFSTAYPAGRPSSTGRPPRIRVNEVTRRAAGGWVVLDEIVGELRREMQKASSAAADASNRMFSGRQRRDAQESAEDVQGLLLKLEEEAARLAAVREETVARRDAQADATRAEADGRLKDAMSTLSDSMRRLPPAMTPWNNPSWLSWSPVLTHAHVLLGMLRPQTTKVPGKNHGFGWDARTPAFVPIRQAVQISHRRQDRDAAQGLARSLLLRALACTAPGKLRLSVFDPTGLGQAVSSLLELGEYDRDLIGGKVWASGDDLYRVLAEHTAHIELVIQKYLRADYETLDEFNTAAGEIAEPYRMLAIFDAPTGFDERSQAELRRIVENGPRCGVATLLLTDEDLPAPFGVSLDTFSAGVQKIRLHVPVGDSAVTFDLLPETDAAAPEQVVRMIIDQVGKSAQDSTSGPVLLEKTFGLFSRAALEGRKRGLPHLTAAIDFHDPESWWTQTTVESVAAPIGQRGARDVATLTLDSSDHAGALLVGRPGSGKSTLLHTFIAGITTMYGPEELELHLIDFKEGVEFKVYAANSLPHARTVAIESDREFGVSVLQAIAAELTWRGSLLRGSEESHSSLETLRKATGERLPRIVLVFDEFQVLFARNDRLGSAAAEILETLIRQGRGFGVHVVLGSQSLSGLDALGSHVPQLLPVRILLSAADSDAFKVLGEGNTEGASLTSAGEGILNTAGGAVEANERFRGAVIDEEPRRSRVSAMRAKADTAGFQRRPVVFEGNAPIPAEDTPPARFIDEIRGADARTLRLRFGAPMAITGSADINLRRESGANVVLVARDGSPAVGLFDTFSLPRAVTMGLSLSAVAQRASVEVVDFLPIEEGLETLLAPLLEASAITVSRRRQAPGLLKRLRAEVQRRVDEDDSSGPATFLILYGMHRARDFDQDSIDYDAGNDLPGLLGEILRDGPEVGIHTFMWFDTADSIGRRLPARAIREASWRLAGKMSTDDSSSFVGVDAAGSLREQQVLSANEDRGLLQRCTTISAPSASWTLDLLSQLQDKPLGDTERT